LPEDYSEKTLVNKSDKLRKIINKDLRFMTSKLNLSVHLPLRLHEIATPHVWSDTENQLRGYLKCLAIRVLCLHATILVEWIWIKHSTPIMICF